MLYYFLFGFGITFENFLKTSLKDSLLPANITMVLKNKKPFLSMYLEKIVFLTCSSKVQSHIFIRFSSIFDLMPGNVGIYKLSLISFIPDSAPNPGVR